MRIKENLLGTAYNQIRGRRSPLRIAIVGSQASGKTVFLTSLIAHLQNHDGNDLDLGNGVEILKCETLKNSSNFSSFPYEYYRSTLVHNSAWPAKTTDVSEIRLQLKLKLKRENKFMRSRNYSEQIGLEFLDFPGERAADFLMYSRDYEEWSDMVLESIQADHSYSELAREFNALVEHSCAESELIYAYKKFLGEALTQRYSRIITPSVYLIDREGKRPPGNGSPKSWCAERFCGLDASQQFVPLSLEARSRNKKLVAKFKSHYRNYKRKIVDPLVCWLEDADQMYILLDIPQILSGGSSMYNDEQAIAERIMEICDPDRGFWHDLLRVGVLGWLLIKPTRIQRLGIVATKSDLVSSNDDVSNLEKLAKDMTYKKLRGISVSAYNYFTCSTVKSTKLLEGQSPRLKGRLVYDENGERFAEGDSLPVAFAPSRVPEHWPKDGEWGDFSFPEVYPEISARRDTPPRQEGLERIVKYFLGL